MNNQDNTACFTPYTESSGAEGSFAKGCDIYVEPNVTVTGIPITWTGSANLNFYWASNAFYTIESLYLEKYGEDIDSVGCGGESGPDARTLHFDWVVALKARCDDFGVPFYFHQTGARLFKDGRLYHIPRRLQHVQAKKAFADLM